MVTGVPGLDLILNGGLEPGAVVVVAGAPGTGKTILAQQMCFARATAEHKCVYYTTMSEPHNKIVRHLAEFAFFNRSPWGQRSSTSTWATSWDRRSRTALRGWYRRSSARHW